ncbi:23S rRNA (pseudouridine(1915)-N(3))-methyltransferase RlmH [Megalodesulfovibrio paquesii]
MRMIRLLSVGRFKADWWKRAAEDYSRRIARFVPFEEKYAPDGAASLPPEKRMQAEGERLLTMLEPKDFVIVLDERGRALPSETLARELARQLDDPGSRPCFVVGGAWGLDPAVKAAARQVISLGPMTLPHELARVVLLEQLYRALSILKGLPYHHE